MSASKMLKEYWDVLLVAAACLIFAIRVEGRINMVEEKANEVKEIREAVHQIQTDVAVIRTQVEGKR